MTDVPRFRTAALLMVFAAGMVIPAASTGQRGSLPVDLPDGPASDGFDITRFSNVGNGVFETFHVERTEPLETALREGRLAGDTRVLVIRTAAGPLALVRDQMVFHHIAQGRAAGRDWMATF